jgi:hypothetical protein
MLGLGIRRERANLCRRCVGRFAGIIPAESFAFACRLTQ